MKFLLCATAILLIAGCDYFDDDTTHPDEEIIEPVTYDSTPVILPPNADWELIATLERNPLKPATFYIFDWQKEVINQAYRDGKHFIFEIGNVHRGGSGSPIRFYILQPTPPFRDEDKHPNILANERANGGAFYTHYYYFPSSQGWYRAATRYGEETVYSAIGLEVIFDGTVIDGQHFHSIEIGLYDSRWLSLTGIGGDNYIRADFRLRIYVNK